MYRSWCVYKHDCTMLGWRMPLGMRTPCAQKPCGITAWGLSSEKKHGPCFACVISPRGIHLRVILPEGLERGNSFLTRNLLGRNMVSGVSVQGYLAHKKQRPPRILQKDYA